MVTGFSTSDSIWGPSFLFSSLTKAPLKLDGAMLAHGEAAAMAGGPAIPSHARHLSGLSKRGRCHPHTQTSTMGSLPPVDGGQPWEEAQSAAPKCCASMQPRPSAPKCARPWWPVLLVCVLSEAEGAVGSRGQGAGSGSSLRVCPNSTCTLGCKPTDSSLGPTAPMAVTLVTLEAEWMPRVTNAGPAPAGWAQEGHAGRPAWCLLGDGAGGWQCGCFWAEGRGHAGAGVS